MGAGAVQRIEACVDAGASSLLAVAVLFSSWKLDLPILLATGWGLLTFMLCFWLLGSIDAKRAAFAVRDFAPADFEADSSELLLEDDSSNAGTESRVVRLFDPSAAPHAAPPDASEALYAALTQLRRSLR
jgi:hypothetical protein